jgi:uncharacterized protein YacL
VSGSKRDLLWVRVAFIVLFGILGGSSRPFDLSAPAGALCGVATGCLATLVELWIRRATPQAIAGASIGVFAGTLLGLLIISAFAPTGATGFYFRMAAPIAGGYIGLLIGAAKSPLLGWRVPDAGLAETGQNTAEKILDTSVLIDGRIADIAEAGFLDGKLNVPQFVLHELQLVADSSDSAKRNRGRRGLDVVQRLQKTPGVRIEVSSHDYPAIREVDLKLIELAKLLGSAKIVTNDFNLNKLAQVQGVEVLNINELANALKPVVLPGEAMRVFILKEGKEYNQGVAYLDDGTMVVVDNARRLISKTVDITVTSVLQTTAGKMIFGKYDERSQTSSEHRAVSASATASGTQS